MSAVAGVAWTSLVPFAAGQAVALEIRKFVFTIKGDGRVTALTDETVGLHMHVPPQLGIEETALDLVLTVRDAEAGNGLRLDTMRKGESRRTEHDDMAMTVLPSGKVRVERAASPAGKAMGFTIARDGARLVIGDLGGFGQLDGATITLKAGWTMRSHDDCRLDLKLADGRTLSAPLWWYPRPIGPTPATRDSIELMPTSRHWPKIDKDISIASMQQRPQASGAMR